MKTADIKLISASAGSGKTYKLMELVHEEVTAGLRARGLVAVTYTKKAAEELKQRIREKLIEAGKLDAAHSMAAARIGTVHAVCADLLKRFSFEDGSSPRQKVIDELEAARLFDNALNEILTETHFDELAEMAQKFSTDVPSLIKDIRNLAIMVRQNNLSKDDVKTCVALSAGKFDSILDPPKSKSTQQSLVSEIEQFLKAYPQPPDTTKKTADAHRTIENIHSQIKNGGNSLPWSDWVRLTKLSPGVKSEEFFKRVTESARSFMSNGELRGDLRRMIELGFSLSSLAADRFATKKKNLGVLDYGDLEEKTLRLLDQAAVREQLSAELDVLFVDEFQDTNPIQLAIFLKLSSVCKKTVWVGDLKQSIYRFRGADPELMKSVAAQLSGSNTEVLKDNWRSTPEIVSFVNALFTESFSSDEIPSEQVFQNSKWEFDVQKNGLEVWEGTGKNKAERISKLAYGISSLLADSLKVIDRETEKSRSLRAGDISILCRSNDECVDLSLALNQLGLATSVVGGQLLELPEVSLALAAFRFLTNPRDTVAAAEIALGLGSVKDAWLESAVREENPESWHPALDRLSKARATIAEMSIREKLDLAIASVPVESVVERLSNGDARLFHISSLRQEVNKYEDACQASFQPCTDHGFLEYLEGLDPPVPSASHSDAICITTYHSSKGLEWPVLILASLEQAQRDASLFGIRIEMLPGSKFDPQAPLANRAIAYLPWPFGNYSAIPEIDVKMSNSEDWRRLQISEDAELRRLLYVGMTRGREKLILLNSLGKTSVSDSMLGVLVSKDQCVIDFSSDRKSVLVNSAPFGCAYRTLSLPPDGTGVSESSRVKNSYVLPQGTPLVGPVRPLFLQPSHLTKEYASELTGEIKKGRSNSWGSRMLLKKVKGSESKDVKRRDVVGSAVHLFLASDEAKHDPKDRTAMAEFILDRWHLSNTLVAEELIKASDRLNGAIREHWPNSKIYREVPMELALGDSIVRGSIDCLVVSEHEVAVIDHKTIDATLDQFEEVAKQYQIQLVAYAKAVERQFSEKKVSTWIHNPDGWLCEVVQVEKQPSPGV